MSDSISGLHPPEIHFGKGFDVTVKVPQPSISSPFIHRPVGTSLLTIAIALVGVLAYFLLPVAPLPQVEYPAISVSAGLPGASPETMASAVATPLERQFGRIAGVTEMTSSSTLGSTQINLMFDLSRNIDAAARDVQAAINGAMGQLPANLPGRPSYRKVNPADSPILMLALRSGQYSRAQMYDMATSILQQKLSQVEGVGQVQVWGGANPAVRVEVNPTALNGRGLTLEDLRPALGAANANRPKGWVEDSRHTWSLETTDQLLKAVDYENLIVYSNKGAVVRLRDVATVTDSIENIRNSALFDGTPAILIPVFRQPGANVIDTVDRVVELLPLLQASIPSGMHLDVAMDRTTTIRASVNDTQRTLLISMLLVVGVVFLFLRDWRSTLIPSVAVPISLLGTAGVMYLLHYSRDNLSLMAMTIATGFVVDDAIVVVENVTRHLEAGMKPLAAALKGAREIGFTVISMSVSLIAVFIPILMMGGIVGRIFREFAVTLSVAIAVSLVVSLTTTPMMCALLLKEKGAQKHGWFFRGGEVVFGWMLAFYEVTLSWVLRNKAAMLLVTPATVVLSAVLLLTMPGSLFPQQDVGRLGGNVQTDQAISYQALVKLQEEYARVLAADPSTLHAMAFAQTGGVRFFVTLKPLNERQLNPDGQHESVDDIMGRLRKSLAHVPGATLFMQAQQDIQIGGRGARAMYQYTLQAESLNDLLTWAPKMYWRIKTLPGLVDVNTDQQDRGLEADLQIDRDTAGRLGLTAQVVDDTLYDAFGQRQVSTMYQQLNQYHVVMEVAPQFWQSPDGLKYIYIKTPQGGRVPLSAIAAYGPSTTALSVNHQGLLPAVTISFNLLPGTSLSDAVTEIQEIHREMGVPASIHESFAGVAQAFQQSRATMPWLFAAAFAAVYIVLGMLYESLIHPVTILSTLFSAFVGALVALKIGGFDLSLMAAIGIILLIGIVKKNGIMMVDFALEVERSEGVGPEEAIFRACLLRFRPIMMTTMAALLGGLPLALGRGVGSELRRPLGIAIVGGLIFSQMLTLYTTPVIYVYMDKLRLFIRWVFGMGEEKVKVGRLELEN